MPSSPRRARVQLAAGTAVAAVVAALVTTSPTPATGATAPAAASSPDDVKERAIKALKAHPGAARAADGQAFVARTAVVDRNGATHVHVDRTYHGLPVRGGDLVVHQSASGTWRGVSQTLPAALTMSTKPSVSRDRAESAALAKDRTTRQLTEQEVDRSQLVVDTLSGSSRLAYEVVTAGTYRDGTPSRLVSYVDAQTGDVLRREERIETVDGEGHGVNSGTVPLNLTQSGTTYQLKDGSRGGTYTVDAKNATDPLTCTLLSLGLGCVKGTLFTSPDTVFGDGTTANRESSGVDAQYGTDMTWDYYLNVHGRKGIFGNGAGSWNRVHYGKNYVNAFWDGSKMTYGDGDGVNYGPLVSLDVAGHEMTHGVTQSTAGLTYSGESGGLNEATSDILGTMVEFYANNASDPGDYVIGDTFDLKSSDGVGLRHMDDQSVDGASAACYRSDVGSLDVHYSSGVANHFFYLLAEGMGPKTFDGLAHDGHVCAGSAVSSVPGIGREAAGAIWFRALDAYMTSGTNYAGARTATLSAAADLYGTGSAQYNAVAAAWSAVLVG